MATTVPFRLPDLGEGLTEGHILRWLVEPGQTVELNQVIVEVETAKAAVELPSPHAGVVAKLLHAPGDTVDVGAPIITFELADTSSANSGAAAGEAAHLATDLTATLTVTGVTNPNGAEPIAKPAGNRTAVLVGYGPLQETASGRRPKKPTVQAQLVPENPEPPAPIVPGVLAKPPVRKLARELGVSLDRVAATGPHHTVTRDDVLAVANGGLRPRAVSRSEQRIPVTGVRLLTAEAMVTSAFSAPHVTVFLTVDVTSTMQLLAELKQLPEFATVKVGPLLMAVKATLFALSRHPEMNASWDAERAEIVQKNYINLGIAAATPRGLLVPVIADADTLSTVELATQLADVAAIARSGHVRPSQLSGGTFSISNVGVFGVDAGTPILPPGQGAILAIGTIALRPWVHEAVVVPRQVATLSLSFDHRMIDGEQGSKFLADIGRYLRNPALHVLS
ncbi:MAG: branched-chain alpha-keto acid dehydrogenase subunit E2 [Acidimicrobiales bacterium]|nr:MAG: branched-chain alpha-keto acid dehydrogenase subunit E2 [Acidimicrobiales bacterium]